MDAINEWLRQTRTRATLISEAYRLQLGKLWWANLMFVVVPAVLSTAAAIIAALPEEKAKDIIIYSIAVPPRPYAPGSRPCSWRFTRRSSATSSKLSASGSVSFTRE